MTTKHEVDREVNQLNAYFKTLGLSKRFTTEYSYSGVKLTNEEQSYEYTKKRMTKTELLWTLDAINEVVGSIVNETRGLIKK